MPTKCYAYILISDKKWWDRLCKQNRNSNETYVFVRRNRVGPLKTRKLLFYVKRPIMQIRGTADFIERLAGYYEELWSTYGHETCLKTFNEYTDFLQGRRTATFIRFTNFRKLEIPISMEVISKVLGVRRIPRGGKCLNPEAAKELAV